MKTSFVIRSKKVALLQKKVLRVKHRSLFFLVFNELFFSQTE